MFRCRIPTDRPVLQDELSDYLNEQLLDQFNVEAADDSEEEVAQLLIDVFLTCGKRDFSIADQVRSLYSLIENKGDVVVLSLAVCLLL